MYAKVFLSPPLLHWQRLSGKALEEREERASFLPSCSLHCHFLLNVSAHANKKKESRVIERRRGKEKSVCPLFLWQETSVLFKSHRCSIVHEIRKKIRALLIKSTENLHFLVSHRYLFLGPDASSSFAFSFPSHLLFLPYFEGEEPPWDSSPLAFSFLLLIPAGDIPPRFLLLRRRTWEKPTISHRIGLLQYVSGYYVQVILPSWKLKEAILPFM